MDEFEVLYDKCEKCGNIGDMEDFICCYDCNKYICLKCQAQVAELCEDCNREKKEESEAKKAEDDCDYEVEDDCDYNEEYDCDDWYLDLVAREEESRAEDEDV